MTDKITLEQFVERFNQEGKWNSEVLDTDFLNANPFLKSCCNDFIGCSQITPEMYDYSSAQLYESSAEDREHYFECQMYCNETYGTRYLWIHPDLDEKAYKESRIKMLKRMANEEFEKITGEIIELSGKKSELDRLMKIIG